MHRRWRDSSVSFFSSPWQRAFEKESGAPFTTMNNVKHFQLAWRPTLCNTAVRVVDKFNRARWLQHVLIMVLWLGFFPAAMAAQTLGGTRIGTQASATYRMDDMVQTMTVWSCVSASLTWRPSST